MTNEWLTLKDAAELLGVHPSTVRTWSDKGLLPVHRTQGGHRRYKRSEVELWAENARRSKLEPEAMLRSAVRNVRVQIAEGRLEAERWYQKLDEEARARYRQSAHSLFQGLMTYLSSDGTDAESDAHAIGFEYASRAHRNRLDYVEAAQAFLFFRNASIESVLLAYRQANVPFDKVLHRMHVFTDEILVSLLEAYQTLETGK